MAIDLSTIKKEKIISAPRVMVYGRPGIGKSTFASEAPDMIFLNVEGRLDHIECAKYPEKERLSTFEQAEDFFGSLLNQNHKFKTLAIDTADWLEKIVHEKVARDNKTKSIEDIPYGAGYAYAMEVWRELFKTLDKIRIEKNMAIIIVAHADVKKHANPMGENYDCYVPKLHGTTTKGDSALGMMTEWLDAILFVADKVYTKTEVNSFDKNKKTHKAVASELVLYTSPTNPAFRAKNSYNLPPELPFIKGEAWQNFYNAFVAGVSAPTEAKQTNQGVQ